MKEISKKITGETEITEAILTEIEKEVKSISDLKTKIEESLKGRLTEVLEIILGSAIHLNVSDIHFEPKEENTKLRVRIDGLLQDILFFDSKMYQSIISRVKLLSELKLNIADRPQDGRFSILTTDKESKKPLLIEIRTSILPSEYGETIVLRILNPKSLIDLETLGLRKDLLELFNKEIKKPNGMIVITGPTGSGKTTTLYAFLKKIQSPEAKVITIEDPIEYHLKGISQTQVNPSKGYDFANGLRSIMRQDPDVVLVGEVRDLETASISLQAALTGHLVFTTLHTNDAAGTVTRLQALGEKAVNIAPAINMAIAQRLIRRVCKKCAKIRKASEQELEKLKKGLKNLPKSVKIPKIDENIKIPEPAGCKECNNTGYKGRTGIYEAFLIDDEMEKFILTSPSIAALNEKAVEKGMISMYQDGLIKILEGITTIEEVEKATGD
ncbi:MAG: GspE/PulE family protein [Patescibacteria group bacterium]|nr:GspE/PulE family protein [Patescibacteria group bacterium]